MDGDNVLEPIRTARLELVPISAGFVDALLDGDRERASMIIGAVVGGSLARDHAHVVQLAMAQALPGMPPGGGRLVVLAPGAGLPPAIGSVGFHGLPDDRGRMEAGCRVLPAYRGRGYAVEALTAMFAWAATRLGITRFLVAVSAPYTSAPRPMTELALSGGSGCGDRLAELERNLA